MDKKSFRRRWKRNVRQHKTKGAEKARRRRYYVKNRAERRRYSRMWRRKNRSNTDFKRSESRRRKTRRTRINASETQEYALRVNEVVEFLIGPQKEYGYVTSISPEEMVVYVMIESPDYTGDDSFPVELFMKMAIFLDEEDLEEFYGIVDREIGPEAYGDLDPDMIEECAGRYGMDPESEAFRNYCVEVTGKGSPQDMDEDELEKMVDSIMGNTEEGEMEGKRATGEIILFDQWNPSNREITQPGEDVGYSYTSPIHYKSDPDQKKGIPPGNQLPWMGENTPPATSRVIPNSMTQNLMDNYSRYASTKLAATIPEILANCGSEIAKGSKKVQFDRTRILPEKGMITYSVKGSKGETYKVWLKAIRKGNVKAIAKMQVMVSCSCNFFRWSGPEHWAKQNGFLYGRPFGTASKPVVRDPSGKHWVCKHLYAILNEQSKLRFASITVDSILTPMDAEGMLEFRTLETEQLGCANPARVASRFVKSMSDG